jgi:hypothetical protein
VYSKSCIGVPLSFGISQDRAWKARLEERLEAGLAGKLEFRREAIGRDEIAEFQSDFQLGVQLAFHPVPPGFRCRHIRDIHRQWPGGITDDQQ